MQFKEFKNMIKELYKLEQVTKGATLYKQGKGILLYSLGTSRTIDYGLNELIYTLGNTLDISCIITYDGFRPDSFSKRINFALSSTSRTTILAHEKYKDLLLDYFSCVFSKKENRRFIPELCFHSGKENKIRFNFDESHLYYIKHLFNYYQILHPLLDILKDTQISNDEIKPKVISKCIDCNMKLEKEMSYPSSNPKDYLCPICKENYNWDIVNADLEVHYSIGAFLENIDLRRHRWRKHSNFSLDRESEGYLGDILHNREGEELREEQYYIPREAVNEVVDNLLRRRRRRIPEPLIPRRVE